MHRFSKEIKFKDDLSSNSRKIDVKVPRCSFEKNQDNDTSSCQQPKRNRPPGRLLPVPPLRLEPIKRQSSAAEPTIRSIPSWETKPLSPIQTTPTPPSHSPRPSPPHEPIGARRRRPFPPSIKAWLHKRPAKDIWQSSESSSDESMHGTTQLDKSSISSSSASDGYPRNGVTSSEEPYDTSCSSTLSSDDSRNRVSGSAFAQYTPMAKNSYPPTYPRPLLWKIAEKAPVTIIKTDQNVAKQSSSMELTYYDYVGSLQTNCQVALQPISYDDDMSPVWFAPAPTPFRPICYSSNSEKAASHQSDISSDSPRAPFHTEPKSHMKQSMKTQNTKRVGTPAFNPKNMTCLLNEHDEANSTENIKQRSGTFQSASLQSDISNDSRRVHFHSVTKSHKKDWKTQNIKLVGTSAFNPKNFLDKADTTSTEKVKERALSILPPNRNRPKKRPLNDPNKTGMAKDDTGHRVRQKLTRKARKINKSNGTHVPESINDREGENVQSAGRPTPVSQLTGIESLSEGGDIGVRHVIFQNGMKGVKKTIEEEWGLFKEAVRHVNGSNIKPQLFTQKKLESGTRVTLHFQWPPKHLFKLHPARKYSRRRGQNPKSLDIVKSWVHRKMPKAVKDTAAAVKSAATPAVTAIKSATTAIKSAATAIKSAATATKSAATAVYNAFSIDTDDWIQEYEDNEEEEIEHQDKKVWLDIGPEERARRELQLMHMTMNTKARWPEKKPAEIQPPKPPLPTREELLSTYVSTLRVDKPPVLTSRIKRLSPEEKKRIHDDIKIQEFRQNCRTETLFKKMTKMRRDKGLLDTKYAEYPRETSLDMLENDREPQSTESTEKPKTAVEAFDQLFPESARATEVIPSWYTDSMKAKVAAKRAAKEAERETELIQANSSSLREDVPYHTGLMKVIQEVGAGLKATKNENQCPAPWSDMLNPKLPCPSLDEWPEWENIQHTIDDATTSLKDRMNTLLQRQEDMRHSSRLQVVTQMRGLDIQRHADVEKAIHPWMFSTEGKQDRNLKRWLQQKTLGRDTYRGCGGCRMLGYEMNLRDNRPHTVMYPGLKECASDDYSHRLATEMDLNQLVKKGYGGKIRM